MKLFNLFKGSSTDSRTENTCDYTKICSAKEAEEYYQSAHLAKLYLIGLALGGEDTPFNVVYTSKEAALEKEKIDAHITMLLEQGLEIQYKAFPEYKGQSFIPCKVLIEVDGDRAFTREIIVW